MNGERILIIEDEEQMARYLQLELTYEGYSVDTAGDGRDGYEMFERGEYDLVLLDLMLPGLNGLEVLRRIRKSENTPVVIITCKDEVMDKVVGLDSGADDYIAKPFAIEELLARIRVTLKKSGQKSEKTGLGVITFAPLTIDTQQRMVKFEDTPIELTKTEYDLLLHLVQNKNVVLTRKQIVSAVWGFDYEGHTNIVDVYIRYLRTKIDERFDTKIIRTIRGVGYYAKEQE
ncbi:MAG: response regulator transcription factor [Clostridiales bacterium]|jgi:DNA-binding response OmpR family regulator|nr:response regulator transcription factor [Clostridiales bacterium]